MKIVKQIPSPDFFLYLSIFLVTQITGLLLSLTVCFIMQDFIWGFVRIALINSFILGLSLIGSNYLSRRLLFRLKIVYIIPISFSLILGISIISFFILLYSHPTLFIYYYRGAASFLFINFLFIITLYIISSGVIIYRELMVEKEKTIINERFLKNQMEMKLLISRVNPHFLFNTLNMILSLLKQPQKAETAILNLSDLLRENLEHSEKTMIPIEQEIENVTKYLEIQTLRFPEKLQYTITGNGQFTIPPLIIQPLVENSIKHNMTTVSHLNIDIVIKQENDLHIIAIIDSEQRIESSMLNKGQGLTITKKRVENSGGSFSIINGGIEISYSL